MTIGRLADLPVTFGTKDKGAMPYFQICKALSDYRLGQFEDAIRWGQKTFDTPIVASHAHAAAIVAMAYWKLGKKAEARAMLAKGDSLARRDLPAPVAVDPGNDWLARRACLQMPRAAWRRKLPLGSSYFSHLLRNSFGSFNP